MALKLPEEGISYSVNKHNSRLDLFCDWLEASVIFSDETLYKSDVVDSLTENGVYVEQDFANAFVDDAWAIVERRFRRLGHTLGIKTDTMSFTATKKWTEHPAYSFCVFLSCVGYLYPKSFNKDDFPIVYGVQGSIFEKICHAALTARYSGWVVKRVGWAADNPVKLKDCVNEITAELFEREGAERELWVDSRANEIGLDLLMYSSFDDNWPCMPVMMIQCASGKDWISKRHTPDLNIWSKIISFNSPPSKGFAMPYAFVDDGEFRKNAFIVQGIFFDRYRLLDIKTKSWLPDVIGQEIVDWMTPYVAAIPRLP